MGKVTVDLGDPTLYRTLRKTAAELDRPVRDIIVRFTFDPTDGWLADVLQRQGDATARLGDKVQDAVTTAAFALEEIGREEAE